MSAVYESNTAKVIYYYRKQILFVLLAVTFMSFMMAFCRTVTQEDLDNADGIMGHILNMIDTIFGESEGWAGIEGAKKLLHVQIGDSSIQAGDFALSSGMVGGLKTLTELFQAIGLSMVIIYFLSSMMEDVQFQQAYTEKMVKHFIFLFVAWVLVMNADTIIYVITNAGSSVVDKVYTVSQSRTFNLTTLKKDIYAALNKEADGGGIKAIQQSITNTTSQLGMYIMMFVPWLVCKASGVVVALGCWSRFIEILIYAIVSPLTLADVAKGSFERSSATRAIKNIIALSLSGAVIMLTLYIGREIQISIIADFATALTSGYDKNTFSEAMFSEVIIAVVQAGVVSRANQVAKQALGVV